MADDYEIEVAELGAIVGRDQEAFSRWFGRSEIRLRQSLRSFAQVVDVELVVQEAGFRVWERASTITPDGRPAFLLRWAVTVALNAARTEARRYHRERAHGRVDRGVTQDSPDSDREPSLPPGAGRTPMDPSDPILRVRIGTCHAELPSNPQRALGARLADGGQHSDRDLASALDMSFDAFRKNLERGRRALEECLRRFGIDVREYLR